jgi:hypothetical protein
MTPKAAIRIANRVAQEAAERTYDELMKLTSESELEDWEFEDWAISLTDGLEDRISALIVDTLTGAEAL